MKKIKLFLQKPFIKKYVSPVVRGAIQTIPGGGIAVQLARNIANEVKTEESEPNPHNYLSIAVQIIGVAALIYAFTKGMITPENLIEILKMFIPQ